MKTKSSPITKMRKKYEMLRTMLIDDRAKQYGKASQYNFEIGDESVLAIGFFNYGRRKVQIPNSEIERMGETLINNPGAEMPMDFYTDKIQKVECSIDSVKEVAQKSRQPLSLIRGVYKIIENAKNAIFNKSTEQGESER